MCMAVLEALPVNVYRLAEKRFRTGSFYETKGFSGQRKHCPAFEALGLHEWAVSQIWRHFRRVSVMGLLLRSLHLFLFCGALNSTDSVNRLPSTFVARSFVGIFSIELFK